MRHILRITFFLSLLSISLITHAQERPFIWVTEKEKPSILEKIEKYQWAATLNSSFFERLDKDIEAYGNDAVHFLKQMPFDWENMEPGVSPPLKKVDYKAGQYERANKYMWYLQVGIDCGIAYYLTNDEDYAQCGLDILYAFIEGLLQLELDSDTRNGGWLYSLGEHLREAREIGSQIPIIYDFVYPYIKDGGKPYNLGSQTNVIFPHFKAQQVFRTYADLAVNRGHTGSNWSVLEASSMIQNSLALEDVEERQKYLNIYLRIGSKRQDPLSIIAQHYKKEGDVYPETSQYSNGVASYTTYLMVILSKYNPELNLGKKYKNIPLSLARWEDMKYPNNEIVRFGDGHRYGGLSYVACDVAYRLGEIENVPDLVEKYGPIISNGIETGKYNRGRLGGRPLKASPYFQPLHLLWSSGEITGDMVEKVLPRTDNLTHASLFIQRNMSETGRAEDGLMCFVGGAHMVHGHANGMDLELYGEGEVLGIDNGRHSYGTDIHENYYRLFAAHNTIIVNGNSQSEGGWVNLGINAVQLDAMEPMPQEEALSPYYSFTQTSFVDDKGDLAEAEQLRTIALIRTSSTTGYYVDVFRSKSELAKQYHDYLYHNIGDRVEFLNEDLKLKPQPERYTANAGIEWIQNKQFRHPGWHFFKDVETSSVYKKDITALFHLKTPKKPIFMKMHMIGGERREYTRVLAPRDKEAPEPYAEKPVPVVIARQLGEAWDEPFATVYEPYSGNINGDAIQSVEKLEEDGVYKGLKVTSNIKDRTLVQYIITLPESGDFSHEEYGIIFKGTFAIITTDASGNVIDLYMGSGKALSYGSIKIKAAKNNAGAYLDLKGNTPTFVCRDYEKVSYAIRD